MCVGLASVESGVPSSPKSQLHDVGLPVELLLLKLTASGAWPEVGLPVKSAVRPLGGGGPPGMDPLSNRTSSTVRFTPVDVVAPIRIRLACVVQAPEVVAANGAENELSPCARNAWRIAFLPPPFFWCNPTR